MKLPKNYYSLCLRTFFTAFFLLFSFSLSAEEKAVQLDNEWRALLHYKPALLTKSGWNSSVDSPSFFFSPIGKLDPLDELEANHKEFLKAGDQYRCLFPLRALYIAKKFNHAVSLDTCTELSGWLKDINASTASVIFSASYLNNPASAFGHTLLKVSPPIGTSSDLLGYAVNYAAATQGEDAISYAAKGIFGGYQGFYAIEPFWEKIKKYSSAENRDLWEYPLNLSSEEVKRVLLHIWESREASLDYYYFDENCSLFLLELLEVARPEASLTYSTPPWVIPAKTIRELKRAGFIASPPLYRASALRTLRHKVKEVSTDQQKVAKKVATSQSKTEREELLLNFSAEDQSKVFDIALEYLAYKSPQEKEHRYQLLSERSNLPMTQFSAVPVPKDDPLAGHNDLRLGVTSGVSSNAYFTDLHFRPAGHDLLDSPRGYERGSQIEILNTNARINSDGDIRLSNVKFLDIRSLSPRDTLVRPKSWSLTFARETYSEKFGSAGNALYISGGTGLTFDLGSQTYLYGLVVPRFEIDRPKLGPGVEAGVLSYLNDTVAFGITGSSSYLFGDQNFATSKATAAVSLFAAQNINVRLEQSYTVRDQHEQGEFGLSAFFYF